MRYVKDLFLTEAFLIKGHVTMEGRRLTTYLNGAPRDFVRVDEVTIFRHSDGQQATKPQVLIRLGELLLAHEMVDGDSDETLRHMAERDSDVSRVRAIVGGILPLEISGKIRRSVSERDDLGGHDFLVISEPTIEGIPRSSPEEYGLLAKVPYIIVNRNRVSLLVGEG